MPSAPWWCRPCSVLPFAVLWLDWGPRRPLSEASFATVIGPVGRVFLLEHADGSVSRICQLPGPVEIRYADSWFHHRKNVVIAACPADATLFSVYLSGRRWFAAIERKVLW